MNWIQTAYALQATTTYTIVNNPTQDNALGLILFFLAFLGIVFLFKRK